MTIQGTRLQFASYETIAETWSRHEQIQRGLIVCPVERHPEGKRICGLNELECKYPNPFDCEKYLEYKGAFEN